MARWLISENENRWLFSQIATWLWLYWGDQVHDQTVSQVTVFLIAVSFTWYFMLILHNTEWGWGPLPIQQKNIPCPNLHVIRVLLGLSEPQFLGVVLALVVGLCDCRRTEGGVTQLTIVVLCGQDDPGRPLIQRLPTQDKAVQCLWWEESGSKRWEREERNV